MITFNTFLSEGEALQKISSARERKHPGMKLFAYTTSTTGDTMIRDPKKLKEELVAKRKSAAPDAEKTITKNWERKHKGMTARIKNKGDSYHIGDVWLPPASRNKGVGKRFVKGVTKFAGKQGKDVTLRASAEKGQKDRLHNFYTKSGFQKQGNTDNYVKKADTK